MLMLHSSKNGSLEGNRGVNVGVMIRYYVYRPSESRIFHCLRIDVLLQSSSLKTNPMGLEIRIC